MFGGGLREWFEIGMKSVNVGGEDGPHNVFRIRGRPLIVGSKLKED